MANGYCARLLCIHHLPFYTFLKMNGSQPPKKNRLYQATLRHYLASFKSRDTVPNPIVNGTFFA